MESHQAREVELNKCAVGAIESFRQGSDMC